MLDPAFDVIAVAIEDAGRDGRILLEDAAAFEHGREFPVRPLFLGDEDDAARVAIETVDDPAR